MYLPCKCLPGSFPKQDSERAVAAAGKRGREARVLAPYQVHTRGNDMLRTCSAVCVRVPACLAGTRTGDQQQERATRDRPAALEQQEQHPTLHPSLAASQPPRSTRPGTEARSDEVTRSFHFFLLSLLLFSILPPPPPACVCVCGVCVCVCARTPPPYTPFPGQQQASQRHTEGGEACSLETRTETTQTGVCRISPVVSIIFFLPLPPDGKTGRALGVACVSGSAGAKGLKPARPRQQTCPADSATVAPVDKGPGGCALAQVRNCWSSRPRPPFSTPSWS